VWSAAWTVSTPRQRITGFTTGDATLKVAGLGERGMVAAVHDRAPDVAIEATKTGLDQLDNVWRLDAEHYSTAISSDGR
jgi:hypothetical protein